MRYSGELAALGTAACFGSASNLFAAAGRRMGSRVLNRLRITAAWMFLTLALWVVPHVGRPTWATPTALVALFIHGERLSWRAWVRAGVAIAGVVVLFRR